MDTLAADRLRRALRGRPPVDASTASRRCASAASSATRCASGSTATRSPRAALTVDDVEDALRARERRAAGRPHRVDRPRLHAARRARLPEARRTSRRSRSARAPTATWCAWATSRKVELASAERRAYYRSNGETEHRPGHRQDLDREQPRRRARRARAKPRRIQPSLPRGHARSSSPSTRRPSSTRRSSASTTRWSRRSCWCWS